MRLLTVISIASLVMSIASVVFVLGLYSELDKSGSESQGNNSIACAQLLTARAQVTWPDSRNFYTYDAMETALSDVEKTIARIDLDRLKLGC